MASSKEFRKGARGATSRSDETIWRSKTENSFGGCSRDRRGVAPFYYTVTHRDLEQGAPGSKTQFKVRLDSSDVFDLRLRLNETVEDVMPTVELRAFRKLARGAGRIDRKKARITE